MDDMVTGCMVYEAVEDLVKFPVERARLFEAAHIFLSLCLAG
jgi:hypothetical protein